VAVDFLAADDSVDVSEATAVRTMVWPPRLRPARAIAAAVICKIIFPFIAFSEIRFRGGKTAGVADSSGQDGSQGLHPSKMI
jgi:hypothetical protein